MSLELQGDSHAGDYFSAVRSQLSVAGGSVGVGMETIDAVVNLSAGSIGEGLDFRKGGVLNITGGSLGSRSDVRNSAVHVSDGLVGRQFVVLNSVVEMTGGEVAEAFRIDGAETIANISGGIVGDGLAVHNGSLVNISGGRIGRNLTVSDESTVNISGGLVDGRAIEVFDGSAINLLVQEAFFENVEVAGLSLSSFSLFTDREGILLGKLADGSDFRFELTATRSDSSRNNFTYLADGAEISLRLAPVPEPSSLSCLLASSVVLFAWRRHCSDKNSN
ncbi:hypothetical protein OAS39_10220 [Pirellulales bacterium]|nr:hypothetical protein [Pirellulales bacterium]